VSAQSCSAIRWLIPGSDTGQAYARA